MELFDTSAYKQHQIKSASDPAWDDPNFGVLPKTQEEEFGWELGDTCLIVVNGEKHTGTITEISRRICVVEYCDYFKETITQVSLDISELVITKQTHWRREAWGLSPILLENLQGKSCNSLDLSLQLNLPIGDVSQCLEKLELQGLVKHSGSWIYSLVLEVDLPMQECVGDIPLQDFVTTINSVSNSSVNDSQEFPGTGISQMLTLAEQTCGQQVHHVNHSALEVNATPLMTPGTASQNFLEQSDISDPSTLSSKTSKDYLIASYDPEAVASTLRTSSRCFANSGTLSNGKLLVQRRSAVLGTEKDSLSLPTPTALSSIGKRCPGTSKLTDYLKARGAIAYNQCENPVLLEVGMGLPSGWTDPLVNSIVQEFQTREALHAIEGKLLGTDLTPSLQTLHSSELTTCDRLLQSEPEYARDGNQLSIFPDTSDEPPDPDDYPSLKDYELAWNSWELQYPELAAAVQQRKILEEFESIPGDKPTVANDSSVDWESPYLAKPRDAIAYSKGQQGQLYHYGQRKNSKYGDADSLYYWGYSYQVFDGFKWRSKSKSVPLKKLKKIRQLIEDKAGVATVLAFLGNQ